MRYNTWFPGKIGRFAASSSGATAIEYSLIAAGIAIAIIASVGLLGDELGTLFVDLQVALEKM